MPDEGWLEELLLLELLLGWIDGDGLDVIVLRPELSPEELPGWDVLVLDGREDTRLPVVADDVDAAAVVRDEVVVVVNVDARRELDREPQRDSEAVMQTQALVI